MIILLMQIKIRKFLIYNLIFFIIFFKFSIFILLLIHFSNTSIFFYYRVDENGIDTSKVGHYNVLGKVTKKLIVSPIEEQLIN